MIEDSDTLRKPNSRTQQHIITATFFVFIYLTLAQLLSMPEVKLLPLSAIKATHNKI